MKKKLAATLSVVLILGLAVLGILAYLTSEDSDVNVMTLGNVSIDQLEYERVVDEDGKWVSTRETDKYGYTPDKLKEFADDKPLYPAVFADGKIKWDDRNGSTAEDGTGHQQSWAQVGASGSNQLFDDSVKNAQDKFVFVENTGKSDAYVRTLIAFEQGSVAAENFENVIMTNVNKNHWKWEDVATNVVFVDNEGVENKYVIRCATYLGPKSNPTGILAPETVSYPSLLQVYMRPEATNEDVLAIDGNKNGKYDILVLSQAVQTEGFADAQTALDTAFGDADVAKATDWFKKVIEENTVTYEEEIPEGATVIDSAEDFMALSGTRANGTYYLAKDIDLNNQTFTSMYVYDDTNGANVTFIGNGHTISNVVFESEKENGMNNVGMFHIGAGNYGEAGNSLTVRNLTIKNAVVKGTEEYCDAGVIASYVNGSNNVNLKNVDVINGTVQNDAGNAGLLIGYTNSSITLTDCDVSGTVNGERIDKTGGLVGTINGSGVTATISNCTNNTGVSDFGRTINGCTVIVDGITK